MENRQGRTSKITRPEACESAMQDISLPENLNTVNDSVPPPSPPLDHLITTEKNCPQPSEDNDTSFDKESQQTIAIFEEEIAFQGLNIASRHNIIASLENSLQNLREIPKKSQETIEELEDMEHLLVRMKRWAKTAEENLAELVKIRDNTIKSALDKIEMQKIQTKMSEKLM